MKLPEKCHYLVYWSMEHHVYLCESYDFAGWITYGNTPEEARADMEAIIGWAGTLSPPPGEAPCS